MKHLPVASCHKKKTKNKEEEQGRNFLFGPRGGGSFQHGGAAQTQSVYGQRGRARLSELHFLNAEETGHHVQDIRPERLLHGSRERRHIRGEGGFQDKWGH